MKSIIIPDDAIVRLRTGKKYQHRCVVPDRPYTAPYLPGDILYVKEGWRAEELQLYGTDGIRFRSDQEFVPIKNSLEAAEAWGAVYHRKNPHRWRSPLHLPEWAARLHLRIISVEMQQVQDITQEGAALEGYTTADCLVHKLPTLRDVFAVMCPYWEKNPWVFVYTFSRARPDA